MRLALQKVNTKIFIPRGSEQFDSTLYCFRPLAPFPLTATVGMGIGGVTALGSPIRARHFIRPDHAHLLSGSVFVRATCILNFDLFCSIGWSAAPSPPLDIINGYDI